MDTHLVPFHAESTIMISGPTGLGKLTGLINY